MPERVEVLNDESVRSPAKYVLYWTQMNRRVSSNYALAYAVDRANEFGLPLLVYEGLTCTYPWANDRIHTFMLENVPGFSEDVRALGAGYCFYLRQRREDANDVVYRLAKDAALVVTDDYPTFIPSKHNASVPAKIGVALHAVDSSCIVPMSCFPKREWAAYTLRPKIHKLLPEYFKPLRMPKLKHRWTAATPKFHVEVTDENVPKLVAACEIDHHVPPSTAFRGGHQHALKRLRHFVKHNLRRYADDRNQPAAHATSNLSPYLHFGHISSLEVALAARESEAFIEELIVRRELSFNFVRHSNYESLDSLPDWARNNLKRHAKDRRPVVYSREQMERAETYDDIWNATQKELLLRGKIHGYYRMYWGKKIIEWSPTHREAFEAMIYFHDRYALDGRDPNTWTSVLWCFGLHDRPWSRRPVFGQMRYMSYEGIKRKTDWASYLKEIDHLERTGKDLAAL